jgi:hypothetical protein
LAAAKTLAEALLNVQKAAPVLTKDGTNPHFKNEYVTLDSLLAAILPVLHANDLVLTQSPTSIDTVTEAIPALRTTLRHIPTDDALDSTMPLVLDKATPQGQGSAITYARRYSLASILGLITETDDDGNAASGSRGAKRDPSEAELKKKTYDIAKAALDKTRPTAAEVAKFFGVQASDMQEKETLQRLLEEHGAA